MDKCPHCAAKDVRIAHLERELGIRRHDNEIAKVMASLSVSPTHARLLLRLYAANGKVVHKYTLMDVMSTPSWMTLRTTICRMRRVIGDGLIMRSPYVGYYLTSTGVERVNEALAA